MRRPLNPTFLSVLALIGLGCNQSGVAPQEASSAAVTADVQLLTVTDADLVSLAQGETFLVDLSTTDTVFRIDVARQLGDERVLVRLADGPELPLGEMMDDDSVDRRVLTMAGDPADIDALRRAERMGSEGGDVAGSSEALLSSGSYGSVGCNSNSFSCSLFSCSCSGDDDCNDMFCSGVCGGDAVCDETNGTICWCWRWGRSYSTFSVSRY